MLNLLRSIIPNDYARALFLKGLRWAAAAAAGALVPFLVKHGVSAADASSIAAAVGALILAGGSAAYSYLDAKKVDAQVKTVQASTAQAVAAGIASGATTPQAITSQATAALAAPATASQPLAQTIADLKAGAVP